MGGPDPKVDLGGGGPRERSFPNALVIVLSQVGGPRLAVGPDFELNTPRM